jgi:hypothetical protein
MRPRRALGTTLVMMNLRPPAVVREGHAAMWIAHPADRLNVVRALIAPVVLLSPFWYGFPDGCTWLAAMIIFAVIGDTN